MLLLAHAYHMESKKCPLVIGRSKKFSLHKKTQGKREEKIGKWRVWELLTPFSVNHLRDEHLLLFQQKSLWLMIDTFEFVQPIFDLSDQ